MKKLQGLAALLFLSGGSVLLGAGCMATMEDPAEDGIQAGGEDTASAGQEQRRGRRRFRWGGGGGPGGSPCAWLENGAYCGGNMYEPGNPNRLYRCYQGSLLSSQWCGVGRCVKRPPGQPDFCI
ncbi:hypothetical protein [Polyangium fumosum]|uniref:Lipoprotein n=1 Tax=Polyangium fumosum TaxID=889272 RepID=A0A4U1J921_9BACT|nr:hypothetical protein [Polyangium fumosum]TKD03956.1 hypothetical protein E8A74_24185 [Polyangium fumosum]